MTVIKLQSNFIEFPFEDNNGKTVLTLKFDKSDESIINLEKSIEKFEKEKEKLANKENASFEDGKKVFAKIIDSVFGEGSFEAMYKLSPSTINVLKYFTQMANGIFKEINTEKEQEKFNKYLS